MLMDDGHLEYVKTAGPEASEMAAKNPGLVFRVGETVKLKDGDFRVHSMGTKHIVLEVLPGTRIVG